MPKLIVNELKEAERIIKNGFTRNINFTELSLLAKYYRNRGLGFRAIEKKLLEVCYKHIPYFDEDSYIDLIQSAINVAKRYKIKENVRYVLVTKSELEVLKNLPLNYRKILFVMLVLAKKDKFIDTKVKEGEKKEFGYYCNYSIESVCNMINIHLNKNEINDFKYFADGLNGLIGATRKGASFWKILFTDDKSEPAIVVEDFENILGYLPFFCEKCGKPIEKKSNRQKMCSDCWKEKEKERAKQNYKNRNSTG